MKNLKNLGFIGAGTLGAVAITVGAAGVAGAQDVDPDLVEPDAADTVEEDTNEDSNRGRRGNRGLGEDRIAALIEEGVITQDQADDLDAIRTAVQEQRAEMQAEKLAAIADVLDITVEDLEAAKEEGQSLAEIAGDNVDALVDYFVEQKTEKINEKVAEGELTQEEADEKIAGLEERIESRIENGGGFGRRGHGNRGAAVDADGAAEEAGFQGRRGAPAGDELTAA
jgi:DNA-binding ferritin-like protein (Dps family)